MVHIPKLRAEQRTEVPELAAAATVGIQDGAPLSQRSTMPSNHVCACATAETNVSAGTTTQRSAAMWPAFSRVNLEKGGRVGVRRPTVQT